MHPDTFANATEPDPDRLGVETRDRRPAINVKMADLMRPMSDERLRPYLDAAEDWEAEQVFEGLSYRFWMDDVPDLARQHGLDPALVSQEGRSGGWLVYDEPLLIPESPRCSVEGCLGRATVGWDAGELRVFGWEGPYEVTSTLHVLDHEDREALRWLNRKWLPFRAAVLDLLAGARADWQAETAHLAACRLDFERERRIEAHRAEDPGLTTRSPLDDPVFGMSRPSEAVCDCCDGYGWVTMRPAGSEAEAGCEWPCPACERGREAALPVYGIDTEREGLL